MCLCEYVHTYMWASYSGSAVCRSSLADQEFNNIQVVVMDGHMKGCQTVLLNKHTHTHTHTHIHMDTYIKTHKNTQKHIYICETWPWFIISMWAPHSLVKSALLFLFSSESWTTGSTDCLTFPAALGLAPLSRRSSATSTFPYLEDTWRGVKPFCSKENRIRKEILCGYYCCTLHWFEGRLGYLMNLLLTFNINTSLYMW